MEKCGRSLLGMLLIGVMVGATGCDMGAVKRLEKENADLREQVKKQSATVEYDLQSKCSKEAKEWYGQNWVPDKETMYLTYTNHYNKVQNKCFILVEDHQKFLDPSWLLTISLWDVNENSKFGELSESHMVRIKPLFTENTLVNVCQVTGTKCTALEEFKNLSSPYMNN